jgi:pseudaminic acid biosynthesis-associated methylase
LTPQETIWTGSFGAEYSERNVWSPEALDSNYRAEFGVTRSDLTREFLATLPPDARILEVGSNVGNQLLSLRKLGYTNLCGVELMHSAVKTAHQRAPEIDIIQGSALDLPFKSSFFDLVFTSGLLIHIQESDLARALTEIARCSKRYIWGFEYFSESRVEVEYRGHSNLLWRDNWVGEYQRLVPGVELVSERILPSLQDSKLRSSMFMLRQETK